jgi:hypothetical protein
MSLSSLFGSTMTTTARITSGIVSIIVLGFIYLSQWVPEIPEKVITGAYAFLAFHIINQLYVAVSELGKKKRR